MRVVFERRLEPSRSIAVLVPVLSCVLALLAGGLLVWLAGANPVETYRAMLDGAFGTPYARSETLLKAIPLMLTGLAVSVAFRMRFWNIGAEGQLALGAIATVGLPLFLLKGSSLPPATLLVLMGIASFAAGALWGLIPAALKAFLKVNEIITTLMLNYVAILLLDFLYTGPWKDSKGYGFPGTASIKEIAALPRMPAWLNNPDLLSACWRAIVVTVVIWFLLVCAKWVHARVVRSGSGFWPSALPSMARDLCLALVLLLALVLAGGLEAQLITRYGAAAGKLGALVLKLTALASAVAYLLLDNPKWAFEAANHDDNRRAAKPFAVLKPIGNVLLVSVLVLGVVQSGTLGGRVHVGIVIALVASALVWIGLSRTQWGFEIRVIGENPAAAHYAGISLARNILLVMILSGGLAGLAGYGQVAGIAYRLQKGVTVGDGFTAIIIAWLARLHPIGVLLVAVLMAALTVGGDQLTISMGLPAAMARVLQGSILFFVLAGDIFVRHRLHLVRRAGAEARGVE